MEGNKKWKGKGCSQGRERMMRITWLEIEKEHLIEIELEGEKNEWRGNNDWWRSEMRGRVGMVLD